MIPMPMRRIVLKESGHIYPFNEPARDLRVQNVPLWLWQRDILSPYISEEREYKGWTEALEHETEYTRETLIHRDNLFFNQEFVDEFISRARSEGAPLRAAFSVDDGTINNHVLPLSQAFDRTGDVLLADMWYLPEGISQSKEAEPLVIDTEPREVGYYNVPTYMASFTGELTYHLPRKAFISLDSWIHLFVIDILFGVFTRGKNAEEKVSNEWPYRLKILMKAIVEQNRVLDCSEMVKVGQNVSIDPSAIIHGPTSIGDDVTIGPGVVIDNCLIGNNVNISQGCQLMLSVVSDGCFLPFRASLFMTTLMENTIVAQNTCLQMCVIGRDSFIGAGSTFTDFKVLPGTIRVADGAGKLVKTNMPVLGGAVGHHCRLSSGLVIYPARTVESDTVILAEQDKQYITNDVRYEESSHHGITLEKPWPRLYPRETEAVVERR
jgi:carbonic anhydrase/acetyltransferase-like protein (isoleucine patch superfamily)